MKRSHEAMGHWQQISKIQSNKNAAHNFTDAVEILINKPHVVNKRLCGKNILYREELPSVQTLSSEQLTHLLGKVSSNWKVFDNNRTEEFLTETLAELDSDFRPHAKKIKATKGNDQGKHDTEGIEVVIRELLPKRADIYNKEVEVVIIDFSIPKVTFIPVIQLKTTEEGVVNKFPSTNLSFSIELDNHWLSTFGFEKSLSITGDSAVKTLGFSKDFLKDKLTPQIVGWLNQKSLDANEKSLTQINVERYNQVYQELKSKYGNDLVKNWPMTTDPQKFVFEDIAIASYLLVLWEEERASLSSDVKQSFVDLGCGNGLLVYLLSLEGHPGRGIDIRKRDIWDMFGKNADLQEMAITPSDSHLFPDCDWLIGNHSDELTPWIPVIAARSSYRCRFFVLPCCPWDFDRKFSEKGRGLSLYARYLQFIEEVSVDCGFHVKTDSLRIPSTKKACIIGHTRNHVEDKQLLINEGITNFINKRCIPFKQAAEKKSKPTNGDVAQEMSNIFCSDCELKHQKETETDSSATRDNDPHCNKCDELRTSRTNEVSGVHTNGTWLASFQARNESEIPRNCSLIDKEVKQHCINAVTEKLLSTVNMKELEDGRMWNKGGSIKLPDVAAMFSKDILSHMKNECGGLQTLLKSSHHIFRVQQGCVELRNWTKDDEVHFLAKRKKKGKKPQDMERFWKTKLCWFHTKHPDGCPRPQGSCLFAHAQEELRQLEPQENSALIT